MVSSFVLASRRECQLQLDVVDDHISLLFYDDLHRIAGVLSRKLKSEFAE
jgi:hypothetical protein